MPGASPEQRLAQSAAVCRPGRAAGRPRRTSPETATTAPTPTRTLSTPDRVRFRHSSEARSRLCSSVSVRSAHGRVDLLKSGPGDRVPRSAPPGRSAGRSGERSPRATHRLAASAQTSAWRRPSSASSLGIRPPWAARPGRGPRSGLGRVATGSTGHADRDGCEAGAGDDDLADSRRLSGSSVVPGLRRSAAGGSARRGDRRCRRRSSFERRNTIQATIPVAARQKARAAATSKSAWNQVASSIRRSFPGDGLLEIAVGPAARRVNADVDAHANVM